MLDGNDNATASVTYATNEMGAALCVSGTSQSSKKDAPIVSIKNLVAAGIALAPNPVYIPPLTAAELYEEQDAYMLYLSERRKRERRDRNREPELYLLKTEYDAHTSALHLRTDPCARLSPTNVWPDGVRRRRLPRVVGTARDPQQRAIQPAQAKGRLRARALEREREASQSCGNLSGEPPHTDAPCTPPRGAPECEATTSQTESCVIATSPMRSVAASPRTLAPTRVRPTRTEGWPFVSLAMNVVLESAAIVLGIQRAVGGSNAGAPSHACDSYACFTDQLGDLDLKSLPLGQLRMLNDWGVAFLCVLAIGCSTCWLSTHCWLTLRLFAYNKQTKFEPYKKRQSSDSQT
eukprot:5067681-Pleurochrysis_carterae.AAC.1